MKAELRSYTTESRRHVHQDFHQLILPGHGRLEMEFESCGGGCVGEGYAALITAGDAHTFKGGKDTTADFAVIDLPVKTTQKHGLLARLWDYSSSHALFKLDDRLHHLSDFAYHELKQNGLTPLGERGIELLLFGLMEHSTDNQLRLPKSLQKACRYIQSHHMYRLSSQDIAAVACLSVSHLHALFRSTLDMTPGEYQSRFRLRRGRYLVRQQLFSLSHISQELGYLDQSSFSRAYRRLFGITPSQDRLRSVSQSR